MFKQNSYFKLKVDSFTNKISRKFVDPVKKILVKINEKIFLSLTKLLCLRKYDFDEKVRHLFAIFFTLAVMVAAFIMATSFFMMSLAMADFKLSKLFVGIECDNCIDPNFIRMIVVTAFGIFLFILMAMYLIKNNFQLWLWIFNAGAFCMFNFFHFYELPGGFIEGSPVTMIIIMFYTTILYGNAVNRIFWLSVPLINIVVAYVVDVFTIRMDKYCGFALGYPEDMWIVLFAPYILFGLSSVISITVVMYVQSKIDKNKILVEKVGKSILFLDFSEKENELSDLINKNEQLCTGVELLLKGVIQNLKVYKKFIPVHVYSNNTLSDEESTSENTVSDTESTTSHKSNSDSDSIDYINSENFSSSDLSSRESSNSKGEKARLLQKLNFGLRSRDVVVSLYSIDKFEDILENGNVQKIHEILSDFMCTVNKSISKHRGMINEVSHQRIVVTFNTGKVSVEASKKALCAAMQIKQDLKFSDDRITIKSITFKMGDVLCGNILAGNIAKYVFASPCVDYARRLIDKVPENCISATKNVIDEVKFIYVFKQIGVIFNNSIVTDSLFKVLSQKLLQKQDEWMYEIDNHLRGKVGETQTLYLNAWIEFEKGNLIESRKNAIQYCKNTDDPDIKYLLDQLDETEAKKISK